MAVKPLAGDFGLVLSVVVLLSLMSLISCSSRSFNAQESGVLAEVIGAAECLDCDEKNIKHEHAFKGLQIAIKCKAINKLQEPYYQIKATSELNPKGEFIVKLPADPIGHLGDLTTNCFAQLHDASNTPCPHQTPSNIILLQSKLNSNKLTYSTSTSKLPFSSSTCASAFLLIHKFFHHHHYTYKTPYYKPTPPVYNPAPPVYKPTPPVYNPAPPVYKPTPPVYKPTPPVYNPAPPVYKPTPPVYNPSPPVYKKPIYVPKYPPVYKKPLPPIPEYHPHPKYQIPPSHGWPPLPPFPKYHPHQKHPYFPPSKEVVRPSP